MRFAYADPPYLGLLDCGIDRACEEIEQVEAWET